MLAYLHCKSEWYHIEQGCYNEDESCEGDRRAIDGIEEDSTDHGTNHAHPGVAGKKGPCKQ